MLINLKAFFVFLPVVLTLMTVPSTWAADIRVLSSNAMTETMQNITVAFEKQTGHKLIVVYEPTNMILDRLNRGEKADVVILIKASLDGLVNNNAVKNETAVDVAKTPLCLAMKTGHVKPDITTPESFAKSMLAAQSIAISKVGASGIQFTRALQAVGIYEELKPRIQLIEGAQRVGDVAAEGKAEYAVQLISELLPVKGIEIVGPLPGALNFEVVLAAAVLAGTSEDAAARSLLQFLKTPASAAVFRATGMEPL